MDGSSPPPGSPGTRVLQRTGADAVEALSTRVERGALLVGLAALIPLPFVDELVRRWLLGRLFCSLAGELGAPLTPQQGWRLARRQYVSVLGCILTLVWWPIKKLFRTVVYVLIIKDAADWSADALARCALVHRSVQLGALPHAPEAVWVPLDKAASARLQSPVSRWIRGRKTPPPELARPVVTPGSVAARILRWADGGAVLDAFEEELQTLLKNPSPLDSDG